MALGQGTICGPKVVDDIVVEPVGKKCGRPGTIAKP